MYWGREKQFRHCSVGLMKPQNFGFVEELIDLKSEKFNHQKNNVPMS